MLLIIIFLSLILIYCLPLTILFIISKYLSTNYSIQLHYQWNIYYHFDLIELIYPNVCTIQVKHFNLIKLLSFTIDIQSISIKMFYNTTTPIDDILNHINFKKKSIKQFEINIHQYIQIELFIVNQQISYFIQIDHLKIKKKKKKKKSNDSY